MKRAYRQAIAIGLTALLMLGLFLFARRTDPHRTEKAEAQNEKQVADFSFQAHLDATKSKIDSAFLQSIRPLEDSILNDSFFQKRNPLLRSLALRWDSTGKPDISSEYYRQIAAITGHAGDWEKAGDVYQFAVYMAPEDQVALSLYLAEQAGKCFENSVAADSTRISAIVKLGTSEIENAMSAGDVMQGVQRLLDLLAKDPLNEQANLVLGRNNIVNGDFEKAVERLETVVSVNDSNAEAWFHLGEAHKSLGRKERAIECFEKFKVLMDNEELDREIDSYIESIKNGG